MFEIYDNNRKIPKEKYDIIYRFIIDNYFDRNKELIIKKNEIDTIDAYNKWVDVILNTKDYNILLYYNKKEIIGFASFMYKDDYLCLSEVQFCMVYKNKGYLKDMIREVIKYSDKNKYNKIYCTINSKNELSKSVFTHIGFKNIIKNRYEISFEDLTKWLEE